MCIRDRYLGLVPRQEDSGDIQPQLGISKAGDRMVRKLLVGSAHYIPVSYTHLDVYKRQRRIYAPRT